MNSEGSAPIPATPFEIATLAAKFLPPIDLSEINPGKCWHASEIQKVIGELTTGKGRSFSETYFPPAGWKTPFEVIAEEAVKRAQILIQIAAGNMRSEVLAYQGQGEEARAFMEARHAEESSMRDQDFSALADGRDAVPLEEVVRFALPAVYRHDPANAWGYLRQYLVSSVKELRKKHRRPEVEILFPGAFSEDQLSRAVDSMSHEGPPACIILPHGPDYEVSPAEFPILVLSLREFYKATAGATRKAKQRAVAGKVGSKTQANIRDQKLTRAEAAQLENAARKHNSRKS